MNNNLSFEAFKERLKQFTAEDYNNGNEPYSWLMKCSMNKSSALYHQYAYLLEADAAEKNADLQQVSKWITILGDEWENVMGWQSIRTTINEILEQMDCGDTVVAPFMCGTGKSTAICRLIEDFVGCAYYMGKTDGLIVITDSIERMQKYVDGVGCTIYLDDGTEFIVEAYEGVTVLTADTIHESMTIQHTRPVVIMSTQRYMSMTQEEIRSFMRWEKGKRPVIIVDECPMIREVYAVTIAQILDVVGALSDGVDDTADQEDKQWAIEQWLNLARRLQHVVAENQEHFKGQSQFYFWYSDENGTLTEDDDRFHRVIGNCRTMLQSYEMKSGRRVLETIEAVDQIVKNGCVFWGTQHRGSAYGNAFTVCIDNMLKLHFDDAKVIILDGTGDIHPDYKRNEIRLIDCSRQERRLDMLELRFVNISTSKDDLHKRKDKDDQRKQLILDFLKEQEEPVCKAVFTYKDRTGMSVESFFGEHGYTVNHFGNIKGRNDYLYMNCLAQIGMNNYPPTYYLAYAVAVDDTLREQLQASDRDEAFSLIQEYIQNKSLTDSIRFPILLADLEQNMFRGSIRCADNMRKAVYYVFCSTKRYRRVIEMARERYSRLGAQVNEVEIAKLHERKMEAKRDSSDALSARFWRWHRELKPGTIYTVIDIREAIKTHREGLKQLRKKNKDIQQQLKKEAVNIKAGIYCKCK